MQHHKHIMIKFCWKNFLIDCIKCFLQVYKYPRSNVSFIKSQSNIFSNIRKGMCSKKVLSKTKLQVIMSSRVSAPPWNIDLTQNKRFYFQQWNNTFEHWNMNRQWFLLFEDLYNGEGSLQANKTSKKQNLNLKL